MRYPDLSRLALSLFPTGGDADGNARGKRPMAEVVGNPDLVRYIVSQIRKGRTENEQRANCRAMLNWCNASPENRAACDDNVWKEVVERLYGHTTKDSRFATWKEFFRHLSGLISVTSDLNSRFNAVASDEEEEEGGNQTDQETQATEAGEASSSGSSSGGSSDEELQRLVPVPLPPTPKRSKSAPG
tara:strand:+ start:181 stop:741 length:561 start_codon:yes stop_codon:yes gene_type:complete